MRSTTWHDFRVHASQKPARLALADGTDPRVVEAAARAQAERIADPILIGEKERIAAQWKTFSRSPDVPYLDPAELSEADRDLFSRELRSLQKFRKVG